MSTAVSNRKKQALEDRVLVGDGRLKRVPSLEGNKSRKKNEVSHSSALILIYKSERTTPRCATLEQPFSKNTINTLSDSACELLFPDRILKYTSPEQKIVIDLLQ